MLPSAAAAASYIESALGIGTETTFPVYIQASDRSRVLTLDAGWLRLLILEVGDPEGTGRLPVSTTEIGNHQRCARPDRFDGKTHGKRGCNRAASSLISPAARRTLPRIVIGDLLREVEPICRVGSHDTVWVSWVFLDRSSR